MEEYKTNANSSEMPNMRMSECSRPGGFTAWLKIATGLVLAASMVGCGVSTASKSSSTPTTPTPPVANCAGTSGSAAAPASAKRAFARASAAPQTLSPITPQYFGMHIDVQALPGGKPPLAWPTFPIGTIRMNSTETRWSDIDTCQGCAYDFTILDQWRNLYQEHEVGNPAGDYQIIFTFSSVPQYISSNPSDGCNFVSTSGHQPGSCDPPTDVNADGTGTDATFTNFVTALAQHVNGDGLPNVHYWEMWNEPNDITLWNGSVQQLARMAQDARCVIIGTNCNSLTTYTATAIDPTAQMLTPPPVTSTDETDTALNSPSGWLAAYLPVGGQYADIIAYHGYVEPGDPVEGVLTLAQTIEPAATAANFPSKPIWDTELGYSSADVCDQDVQAGWLAKAYLLQAGVGIQRVAWFEYGASNVGSLTVDGPGTAENTAALDYSVLYNWMVDATPTGLCTSSGTVWSCGFTLPGNVQAEAVWDSSQTCSAKTGSEVCTSSNFSPGSTYTKYVDLQGDPATSITAGSTVPIGAEPILLESQ